MIIPVAQHMVRNPPADQNDWLNEECRGAVARVKCEGEDRGTAFFIAATIAITCRHVVRGCGIADIDIIGRTTGGTPIKPSAILLHDDPTIDFALVIVAGERPSREILNWCPDPITTRERLMCYGYPVKNQGLRSHEYRMSDYDSRVQMQVLDANIERGFSGGPAVARDGSAKAIVCLNDARTLASYVLPLSKVRDFIIGHLPAVDSLPVPLSNIIVPPYQSRGDVLRPILPSGQNSIHLHIDAGMEQDIVRDALYLIDQNSERTVSDRVWDHVEGPQRQILKSAYEAHTPAIEGIEKFGWFSTTSLHAGPASPSEQALAQIEDDVRTVLSAIGVKAERLEPGLQDALIVEAERVVGSIDKEGNPDGFEVASLASIFTSVYTFEKYNPTGRNLYEVHFSIDFPRNRDEDPPLTLDDLRKICAGASPQIEVGGWFIFNKPERWAFRSNMFLPNASKDNALRFWRQLNSALSYLPNANVRVLVEESLAVWRWRGSFKKLNNDIKTIYELSNWEANLDPGSTFWVATNNFLGDQNDSVRQAMNRNLSRDIKYFYLLRSDADFYRWLAFRNTFTSTEVQMQGIEKFMQAFIMKLDDPQAWEKKLDCMVSFDRDGNAAGYKLQRDPRLNRAITGRRMSAEDIASFTNLLTQPILTDQNSGVAQLVHAQQAKQQPPSDGAVVGLSFDFGRLREFDFGRLREMELSLGYHVPDTMGDIDVQLASLISKWGGEVSRGDERVCWITFDAQKRPVEAAERAFSFIADLAKVLVDNIANTRLPTTDHPRLCLAWGEVHQLIRPFGSEIGGDPLDECRFHLKKIDPGCIVALPSMIDFLRSKRSTLVRYIKPQGGSQLTEIDVVAIRPTAGLRH